MGACTLTLKSLVGQPVKVGPDNPSQKATYSLVPSASYATGGDTLDVSAEFTAVHSATIKNRVAISDPDVHFALVWPSTSATAGKLYAVDGSTGTQMIATSDLHAETMVIEVEGY